MTREQVLLHYFSGEDKQLLKLLVLLESNDCSFVDWKSVFVCFISQIGYDVTLLIDMLISVETIDFLPILMRFLKINASLTVDMRQCLDNLQQKLDELHSSFPYDPSALIRLIESKLSQA